MNSSLLNRKTLCIITGASRGIGKEIAVRLSEKVGENSAFLLIARSSENLHRVSSEIRSRSSSSFVEILTLDLSKFASHEATFDKSLEKILLRCDKFNAAIVVHNAGSLGNITKKSSEFCAADEIRDYMELNFVSFVLLNNAFLKIINSEKAETRVIINITSLLAVQGAAGYGLYGPGKAAREGFLKCLAADDPSLRILNYSPGPVLTDMQNQIIAESWSDSTKDWSKKSCRRIDFSYM